MTTTPTDEELGDARFWVVISLRAPRQEGEPLSYEALSVSNDPGCALREARSRSAEDDADSLNVVQVPAVGFPAGALEEPGEPSIVQVVYRFETAPGDDGRVRAQAGVAAVVATEAAAAAFVAGREDASERIVYFGSACPLRLCWAH